jgi:hypothetical protein
MGARGIDSGWARRAVIFMSATAPFPEVPAL